MNAIILNDKYDDAFVMDSATISQLWNEAEKSFVDSNRSFGKITLSPCGDSKISDTNGEPDVNEPS